MKSPLIAAALLGLSSIAVMADDSLPANAMKNNLGVTGGGATAKPTAKPADGSLSDKAMKDAPATAPTTSE